MATTLNTCFTSLPPEFMELIGKDRHRRRQLQADPDVQQVSWISPLVICMQCYTELPRECFSANQLNRGKNRCLSCVGIVPHSAVEASPELGEAWISCSNCLTMLPRPFYSATQLASGHMVCMTCVGNNAAISANWSQGNDDWQSSCIDGGQVLDAEATVIDGQVMDANVPIAEGSDPLEENANDTWKFLLPDEAPEVLVVNSSTSGAYAALRHDALSAHIVAIDAEWLPDSRGSNHPIAVLQLAFPASMRVFVIQLIHLRLGLPDEVRVLLMNPMVPKVGYSVDTNDIAKFHRSRIMVSPFSLVDMQHFCSASLGLPDKSMCGLKRAAEELLGFYGMDKGKRLSCSNWNSTELTPEQVHYAAMDAWVTLRLYFFQDPSRGWHSGCTSMDAWEHG